MSRVTDHASSSAMEKSNASRVRSSPSAGSDGSERAASMLSRNVEYLPALYAMAERAGRLLMTSGVSLVTPAQQPHSCSFGITHSPLIFRHPCGAGIHRDRDDLGRCRSGQSAGGPWQDIRWLRRLS